MTAKTHRENADMAERFARAHAAIKRAKTKLSSAQTRIARVQAKLVAR